jgi:hypothetical protein
MSNYRCYYVKIPSGVCDLRKVRRFLYSAAKAWPLVRVPEATILADLGVADKRTY